MIILNPTEDRETTFFYVGGGNYRFLEGNPKTVLPLNHVTGKWTEPRVSKKKLLKNDNVMIERSFCVERYSLLGLRG